MDNQVHTRSHGRSWLKITLTAVVLAAGIGVGFFIYRSTEMASSGAIQEFDPTRDTKPILAIFERDWYWLVAGDDYSPEFMLAHRAPKQDPLYAGRMRIKVIRDDGTLIGFVAYYMKNDKLGYLNFVDINPEYRGKRYAEKLVRYAMDDMKTMGAKKIDLVTRPSNANAQALYRRLGFVLTQQDPEFVFYSYFMR